MKILIEDGRQYVLFLIGLCGEINYDDLLTHSIISVSYMEKVIRQMIKDKLIRRTTKQNQDGHDKALLRLRDPTGASALMDLSPLLCVHYDLMAGTRGNRFKGSISHKERLHRAAALVQMFYESGIPVDMFLHDYKPNLFGTSSKKTEDTDGSQAKDMFTSIVKAKTIFKHDGSLLPPEQIIARAGANQEIFLTMRALSGERDRKYKNSKNLMHRMYGILIRGKVFFNVYYLGSSGEMWWADVERQAMAITQRYRKDLYPETNMGEGAAIFYTPTPQINRDIFFPPKKVRSRVNPPDAYAHSYLLPLSENHTAIRRMLLIDRWEEKCKSILFPDSESSSHFCDGHIGNTEGYILLANDMSKMTRIIPRMKRREAVIIIHSWQQEIAGRLYPDAKQIVFLPAEFSSLVAQMECLHQGKGEGNGRK